MGVWFPPSIVRSVLSHRIALYRFLYPQLRLELIVRKTSMFKLAVIPPFTSSWWDWTNTENGTICDTFRPLSVADFSPAASYLIQNLVYGLRKGRGILGIVA